MYSSHPPYHAVPAPFSIEALMAPRSAHVPSFLPPLDFHRADLPTRETRGTSGEVQEMAKLSCSSSMPSSLHASTADRSSMAGVLAGHEVQMFRQNSAFHVSDMFPHFPPHQIPESLLRQSACLSFPHYRPPPFPSVQSLNFSNMAATGTPFPMNPTEYQNEVHRRINYETTFPSSVMGSVLPQNLLCQGVRRLPSLHHNFIINNNVSPQLTNFYNNPLFVTRTSRVSAATENHIDPEKHIDVSANDSADYKDEDSTESTQFRKTRSRSHSPRRSTSQSPESPVISCAKSPTRNGIRENNISFHQYSQYSPRHSPTKEEQTKPASNPSSPSSRTPPSSVSLPAASNHSPSLMSSAGSSDTMSLPNTQKGDNMPISGSSFKRPSDDCTKEADTRASMADGYGEHQAKIKVYDHEDRNVEGDANEVDISADCTRNTGK